MIEEWTPEQHEDCWTHARFNCTRCRHFDCPHNANRNPCKGYPERHRACHGNYYGSGKPCEAYTRARKRLDEINAEECADAAIRSVTCLPRDVWKEKGKKVWIEKKRMEGKIK